MSIFSFFKKKPQFQYNPNDINHVEANDYNSISSVKLNDLEFVDTSNSIYATVPISLAKDVPVVSRNYVEKLGKKFTFPICPGMWDYARMGYIMHAWTDFHIKANKAGIVFVTGGNGRSAPFAAPFPMGTDVSEGLLEFNGVPINVYNFYSPWKVFSNTKNISCLTLPAWFHTNPKILENLHIYSGVVDYDRFRPMNVIASIKNKCTIHIKAGEPLMHIIPFFNEKISCGYGPPKPEQEAECRYDPTVHTSHYYRKKHQTKKDSNYKLQENDSEQQENKVE